LFARAQNGQLTEAELATLVAHGSGSLRLAQPAGVREVGTMSQHVALLVLDAHVRARRGLPPAGSAPQHPRRFPARLTAGTGALTGAVGSGLAVLGGMGPVGMAVSGLAG